MFNDLQIRFPRQANGDFNRTGILALQSYQAAYKYTQEGRFCLGVAKVRLNNGDVVGRRCGMFDYTAKRLISVTEYEAKVKEEINRIKANTSINSNSPWISNR